MTQLPNRLREPFPTSFRWPELSHGPLLPNEASVLAEGQGCLPWVVPRKRAVRNVCLEGTVPPSLRGQSRDDSPLTEMENSYGLTLWCRARGLQCQDVWFMDANDNPSIRCNAPSLGATIKIPVETKSKLLLLFRIEVIDWLAFWHGFTYFKRFFKRPWDHCVVVVHH